MDWCPLERLALFLVSTLAFIVLGCTQPFQSTRVQDEAASGERAYVTGNPFRHLIVRHGIREKSGPVHVYFEGDGLPWATRTRISRDPTPRNRLALRLMARDPGPSLYLGRPCYHGLAHSPGCSPWLWTHGRYSEEVVRSMAAALRHALGSDMNREIALIGYSGGGVLAMLIAARIEQVRQLVTIAANLDIDAWADHNGFSRLHGSLNLATQPRLPTHVRQIHLAGGRDRRVPARLSQRVATRQQKAQFLVVPDFDHRCCWERAWPAILAAVEEHNSVPDPTPLRLDLATAHDGLQGDADSVHLGQNQHGIRKPDFRIPSSSVAASD